MNVVWLKRDLRLYDHAPIVQAAANGPVFIMYVLEPAMYAYQDISRRHYDFIYESLIDLNARLLRFDQQVHLFIGEVIDALKTIQQVMPTFTLYSHMEHGLTHTFERDLRVKKWCKKNRIPWHEAPSFGVLRGRYVGHRPTFMKAYLEEPLYKVPKYIPPVETVPKGFLTLEAYHTWMPKGTPLEDGIKGGETHAIQMAKEFFNAKRKRYSLDMSKPSKSWASSSLLSAYLSFGNISIKTLHHATQKHLKETAFKNAFEKKQLKAFESRLYWHCHFVEKVEMKPWIHMRSKDPRYDAIRTTNPQWMEAFRQAMTGFPFVDACMLALKTRGWINFKQRAMMVSFACNTLLLDFKDVGTLLASLFIDYEPGIHWSQVQMQAGLIPKRHIPIYNVIKQSLETDPQGTFIKTFIPSLRHLEAKDVHTPWHLEKNPYIPPIIDYEKMLHETKEKLYAIKKETL